MNAGIYMYISNGGSNRSNIDVSASPGHSNQFKVLHGDGNRIMNTSLKNISLDMEINLYLKLEKTTQLVVVMISPQ